MNETTTANLVRYNPDTGQPLHPVPSDATIPAGATYYLTTPTGLFTGPFNVSVAYTPTERSARYTYFTTGPLATTPAPAGYSTLDPRGGNVLHRRQPGTVQP